MWHEFNVKLPGVSRRFAETFLAEIEGTVKTITGSQGGIAVTFDGDNEAEAVMTKLALYRSTRYMRPGCSQGDSYPQHLSLCSEAVKMCRFARCERIRRGGSLPPVVKLAKAGDVAGVALQ